MLKNKSKIIAGLMIALGLLGLTSVSFAAVKTTPSYLIYEGRLLDASQQPLTGEYVFRFSLWKSADFNAGDLEADGSLNILAGNYTGWNEVRTIEPDTNGIFSIKLGEITSLPKINLDLHKYLQVEVKTKGADDTTYELMDPTGDKGVDTIDRQAIGTAPYADNADMLDGHEFGDGADEIPALNSSGTWDPSQLPDGTDADQFVIDSDDTNLTQIVLQFGRTLGKYLSYDLLNHYFYFNDDVYLDGDLTVTGTFVLAESGSLLTFDTSALTSNHTVSFLDEDMTLVGEDNVQTLTNKTIDADLNTILNLSWEDLNERDDVILLLPPYPSSNLQADGSDNQVTVKVQTDALDNRQTYVFSTGKTTLQDLDLVFSVPVPMDFVSWKDTPFAVYLRTDSANTTDNSLNIYMEDTDGNWVTLADADGLTTLSPIWEAKAFKPVGSYYWTPGKYVTFRVVARVRSPYVVRFAGLLLNYNRK